MLRNAAAGGAPVEALLVTPEPTGTVDGSHGLTVEPQGRLEDAPFDLVIDLALWIVEREWGQALADGVAREIEHERRGRTWTRDSTAETLHLKDDSVTIDRSVGAPPR